MKNLLLFPFRLIYLYGIEPLCKHMIRDEIYQMEQRYNKLLEERGAICEQLRQSEHVQKNYKQN